MDLTPKQQTSEAIRQANAILVVTGQRPSIDQVTGVVALGMILRKLGKKVTALVSDKIPPSITFLTDGQLDKSPEALRDFIIKLDLGRAEVDKLRYTMEGGKLNIHLTPFRGKFSSGDVSFDYGEPAAAGDHQYDLVVALGVPSRLKLDKVLEDSSLGSVPLLNLDFHRINENYGAVNLIEPTASSLSEMLVSLSESLQSGLIDEPIATVLLAGIVASTDRFTATHTTPKALTVAAQLMAAGGKQQQVIKA
ncbi:MAG TPA: DHH family phosphoesterase, partial [Candidatus Saccharimonadales bacterium]|nr:DHH family phosphoesterase [Candidatus Saccharimonadales bacterium]